MATTRGRPSSFDRDAVLDKAIRLFWRRGYEGTSVRDLSEELGIGAPSIYNAFGDKRRFFAEVLRVYDEKYGGFIDAALAEERTAKEAAARVFAEAPTRYSRRGLPTGCLIISGDAGTADVTVATQLRGIREAKVAAFADKIRADLSSGELPADTDAQALARYTMSTLSGIAQAARDGVRRTELEHAARIALNAWP
ncbi:TetR/AcrR family transcriptional regulator [Actinoallomurus iriomotensis]|uniref:TetR family transcriptional regulator n=1 Tax=Actinoallomurus iriomotensis TaxID=478107 RepID=A0A9W6VY98_9ACTN|nr:TetR/AcrR family transcriptional regulator [Actinoallomurus iriomotensis]GLY84084.1 TetR family transcriptional regulator [Actinoallomurus iriomotensis]